MYKQIILLSLSILFLTATGFGSTYYVNSQIGSDANNGLSKSKPFQTIARVGQLKLQAGDHILLAKGNSYHGSLILVDVSGEKNNPIIFGSYGEKNAEAPLINAKGYRNGVLLTNCSYVMVQDLSIIADGGGLKNGKPIKNDMRCGILINTSKVGQYENISITNIEINDVFFEDQGFKRGAKEVKTANGTQRYGWGIRFINRTKNAFVNNLLIQNCKVKNVAHTGIKFTCPRGGLTNLKLYGNSVVETGGPGMQMSGVVDGHVKDNQVLRSGSASDSRKWSRGSGLWTWGCDNIIIENNSFKYANGPADSAGCHIDFNCNNVIVQYNLSVGNAGGFCEILGNNYNCCYRYNVSVNDGHRMKGQNNAFQEGKIFWLSGFVGKDRKRNGPFNSYFYNNTIYVKEDQLAKVAVDRASKGLLVANNIFYVVGESKAVLGDQYKPEKKGELLIENVVFKNNLFLHQNSWPSSAYIADDSPVYGNPEFEKAGGEDINDYIPQNSKLVKDKGIVIDKIPGDDLGIYIGLKAKYDILGNNISGKPDFGAIEMR